ncbi:MAG: alpha-amylase [Muribaculaceae bacterium]|nr:alpha-amylase [Muribaculaceae bacterium]
MIKKSNFKRCALLTGAVFACANVFATDKSVHNPDATNSETIMHVWSWNFPEIARNMKNIADAGFTMLQTSPVQGCYFPEGSGKKIFDDNRVEGNWYYYYQPTNWKIGSPILGTREEMVAMMDSAAKYGVKVLVDVLPNHTAVDISSVSPEFFEAVGGRDKMFHSNGLTLIRDYSDREQCTLWEMGGLPDVNTENPLFQKYFLDFINDLLSIGVKGFRYDTAKHIGVHSDPVDTASGVTENDFWDVMTGRKPVLDTNLALPADSLFIYGEILQDRNVPELEYAEYMGQTASTYGYILREMLEKRSADGVDILNWHHSVAPEYLVSWVESHDTYANAHESAHLTDDQIRTGWVFLTARQNATPLFFSRPAGSTRESYWGNNVLGARGNDEFMHPEVVAVNKFRRAVAGEKESVEIANDGTVLLVNRGDKGAALINLAVKKQKIELPTTLPNGKYKDAVYKRSFKVKNGKLTGTVEPEQTYIIYAGNN